MANAFAEENAAAEKKLPLTNYFIEKTFPVVYRIPAPIITDYRGVFKDLFNKAFGVRDEQDLINRCYRLKHPTPNMREMISFIIVIDIYNDLMIRYFMKMLLTILFCVIQKIKKCYSVRSLN